MLNSMKFSCCNDDCSEEIEYGNYFKHMLRDCKVKTYDKVNVPMSEHKPKSEEAGKKYEWLEYWVLPINFLEEGEKLEEHYYEEEEEE